MSTENDSLCTEFSSRAELGWQGSGPGGIDSTCIAGLYRNDFGIELRIDLGNELIESRLSRYGY